MRIALYSDVHGNLEALNAVLKDMNREEVDKKYCLGDLVGYGPNPNECIETVRENAEIILAGNHDWAAVGLTAKTYFNPYALESLEWTIKQLTDENREFLKTLVPNAIAGDLELAHATPLEPTQWRYILSLQDAMDNYLSMETKLCFIGHSHIPSIMEFADENNIIPIYDIYKVLEKNRKYLINVGSVGQPRDSNREACYLVYDDKERNVEYRRVEYEIAKVQKKMKKHKFPEYIIKRLSEGR
jgi:predicted phosphodiesterase